jgi:hypothetical protein
MIAGSALPSRIYRIPESNKEPPHSCGGCGRVAHERCRRRWLMDNPSARRQECRRSVPQARPGGIRSHHTLVVDVEGWPMKGAGGACSWTNLPHDDKSVVAPYRHRVSLVFLSCTHTESRPRYPHVGVPLASKVTIPIRRASVGVVAAGPVRGTAASRRRRPPACPGRRQPPN